MNPPLTPQARALVAAGRDEIEPSEGDLERVRRRLMVAVAGGAAAGLAASSTAQAGAGAAGGGVAASAAIAGASAGVSTAFKIGLVLALTAAAAAGGGALLSLSTDEHAARPSPAPVVAIEPVARPEAGPVAEPEVELEFAPDRVEPPRRAAPERRPPRAAARPETRPEPSLSQELTLVRRARAALRLGMPDRALELLTQHAARFPAPRLAQEAAVVRIEAVCALGDSARARSLTAEFGRRWPGSPLRARVRNMCGARP
jgi:hypothetical protein